MILVVGNAKLPLQHLGNPGAGPEFAAKPVSLRTMPQKIGDQLLLLRRQLRMTAMGVRQQAGRPALSKLSKPLAYGSFGDPQGVGNVPVNPAQPGQPHGTKTTPFTPIVKVSRFHPSILTPENLSGLRSCQ